jgi:hypothetical protein
MSPMLFAFFCKGMLSEIEGQIRRAKPGVKVSATAECEGENVEKLSQ